MDPNAITEHDPKFYIPSGDVVLAAKSGARSAGDGNPARYHLFRVHKFLLGLRSTVFFTLFADADATASNNISYDGVPLVELHGDSAGDIALLLSYLSFTFRHHDPNTAITVSGVIRLADKYLLEPLRRRLIAQVAQDWPTTLLDWDVQQAEIKELTYNFRNVNDPSVDHVPQLSDVIPEPASAIVFAQEFGCPEILPAAFYRLLQIDFTHDWSLRDHNSSPRWPADMARWSLLDRDNLARYIHGRHAAENYVPDAGQFVHHECIPKFWEGWESDPKWSCFLYVQNMLDVLGSRRGISTMRDPLGWLADCSDHHRFSELSEKYPKGLCDDCWGALSHQVPRERRRIWRELLPKWFRLESVRTQVAP